MCVNVVNFLRLKSGVVKGKFHALSLSDSTGRGRRDVVSVVVATVADNLGVNVRPAILGVL